VTETLTVTTPTEADVGDECGECGESAENTIFDTISMRFDVDLNISVSAFSDEARTVMSAVVSLARGGTCDAGSRCAHHAHMHVCEHHAQCTHPL
jgi:hypothetical protein